MKENLKNRLAILSGIGNVDVANSLRELFSLREIAIAKNGKLSHLSRTNATVLFASGVYSFVIGNRRHIDSFRYVLIRLDPISIFSLLLLIRYLHRHVRLLGFTGSWRAGGLYLIIKNVSYRKKRPTRYYGYGDQLELLQKLEKAGCNTSLLRWGNLLESGGNLSDLDIICNDGDVDCVLEVITERLGAVPVDLYTTGGSNGHLYKDVPYLFPALGHDLVKTSIVNTAGFRVPNDKYGYISYIYHLLFHKTAEYNFNRIDELPDRYYAELGRLAKQYGCNKPETLDDIEDQLKEEGYFPPVDLIGFLSANNNILKNRYISSFNSNKPGLAVFIIREFDDWRLNIDEVRSIIKQSGFQIYAECEISEDISENIVRNVRGGNWSSKNRNNSIAGPVYAYFCEDKHPLIPKGNIVKKYPRLDNQRTLIKVKIRDSLKSGVDRECIHATDNTREALDYAEYIPFNGISMLLEKYTVLDA